MKPFVPGVGPAYALALGAGVSVQPQVLTAGAVKAVGTILFGVQPTVGHTITVSGRTFAFIANGVTPVGDQIALGANLAATGTAIVTAINTTNASTLGKLVVASFNTATLTITAVGYGAAGNKIALASSNANGTVTAMAGGVDGAIDLNRKASIMKLSQAGNQTFPMADGLEGQEHVLVMPVKGSTGNAVVAYGTASTLTFDAAGEMAHVMFLDGKWVVIAATATAA